jgi:hypothetical protein
VRIFYVARCLLWGVRRFIGKVPFTIKGQVTGGSLPCGDKVAGGTHVLHSAHVNGPGSKSHGPAAAIMQPCHAPHGRACSFKGPIMTICGCVLCKINTAAANDRHVHEAVGHVIAEVRKRGQGEGGLASLCGACAPLTKRGRPCHTRGRLTPAHEAQGIATEPVRQRATGACTPRAGHDARLLVGWLQPGSRSF